MTRVSRLAARDPGPAARVAGFMDHLRGNGFRLGVAETGLALGALAVAGAPTAETARLALKPGCPGSAEDVARFDALFDAYWLNGGRVREKALPDRDGEAGPARHSRSSRQDAGAVATGGSGAPHAPDTAETGEACADGRARRVASAVRNLMKKYLRELVSPEAIRAGEAAALRLGRALRDCRSRRRKVARRGTVIDLRRGLRLSLATGGEPLRLARRRRPDRPVRIAALCDVPGSMLIYARPFLAFVAGLMRADPESDAYLFHTRLVRITEALRDDDLLRALNRVRLLAAGIGGGLRIGASLDLFARTYARRFVNGRTVVVILSDGYDSAAPETLGAAPARLKKRGCRILWRNPLKSCAGYEPVARGMAAALPHLNLFAPGAAREGLPATEGWQDSFALDLDGAGRRHVVIATQGAGDEAALAAVMAAGAASVAFVGSRRKFAALVAKLTLGGVDPAALGAIHAPAGLDIGAITPDEIALSILAQIIATHRRGHRPGVAAEG